MLVRPYRHGRDNRLEVVCILVLLYSNFASVLEGTHANGGLDWSVFAAQISIVAFGLWRAVAPGVKKWMARRAGGEHGLELPLLEQADAAGDSTEGRGVQTSTDAPAA